jgi:catechol 2,3-dioxygenase-like lactoylglutathione lyase family enzyme
MTLNSASHDFEISGFVETVVIVRDPEPHLTSWCDVGGWVVRHQGAVDSRLLGLWGLPNASGEEWLVGHPDVDTGYVRLVKLHDAGTQRDIRANDQCWDSGGIFDLNVRVIDVEAKAAQLQNLQWHGAAPPVAWKFGPMSVKEWLVRGPDNVRLALIERVEPPLQGFDHLREFSHAFNSSQIVRNMEASLEFYCGILGFTMAISVDLERLPAGPNVFGLPVELAAQTGLSIRILHPKGLNDGSIELVTLNGASGLDHSGMAGPPHFGMAVLRFPVKGVQALADHLTGKGVRLLATIQNAELAPYGNVRMLGVPAPDGVLLEFFETLG